MLTTRYHIGSLIAVFLALGVGLLVGGTMGRGWMSGTENRLIDVLVNRYEEQQAANKEMQAKLEALMLTGRELAPLAGRNVVWIKRKHEQMPLLAYAVESFGANWQEFAAESEPISPEQLESAGYEADVVLYSVAGDGQMQAAAAPVIVSPGPNWIALPSSDDDPQAVAGIVTRLAEEVGGRTWTES